MMEHKLLSDPKERFWNECISSVALASSQNVNHLKAKASSIMKFKHM